MILIFELSDLHEKQKNSVPGVLLEIVLLEIVETRGIE